MDDKEIEDEIKRKNLNAPRVKLNDLHDKIKNVEICKFITTSGQVLRWAILTMENGFAVVGEASCSVSSENDDQELGENIAIKNSHSKVWELEGYALKQKLFEQGN